MLKHQQAPWRLYKWARPQSGSCCYTTSSRSDRTVLVRAGSGTAQDAIHRRSELHHAQPSFELQYFRYNKGYWYVVAGISSKEIHTLRLSIYMTLAKKAPQVLLTYLATERMTSLYSRAEISLGVFPGSIIVVLWVKISGDTKHISPGFHGIALFSCVFHLPRPYWAGPTLYQSGAPTSDLSDSPKIVRPLLSRLTFPVFLLAASPDAWNGFLSCRLLVGVPPR